MEQEANNLEVSKPQISSLKLADNDAVFNMPVQYVIDRISLDSENAVFILKKQINVNENWINIEEEQTVKTFANSDIPDIISAINYFIQTIKL